MIIVLHLYGKEKLPDGLKMNEMRRNDGEKGTNAGAKKMNTYRCKIVCKKTLL